MSWLFSQALVAEYSAGICLDGEPFAPLNTTSTQPQSSQTVRTTDYLMHSQYGTTSEPLTERHGEAVLMSYLAASHVKPTHQRQQVATRLTTSGRKCGEWWQMSLPGTYLPRTSSAVQLTGPQTNLSRWASLSDASRYRRATWVQTTFGPDIGYLHTPTVTANFCEVS